MVSLGHSELVINEMMGSVQINNDILILPTINLYRQSAWLWKRGQESRPVILCIDSFNHLITIIIFPVVIFCHLVNATLEKYALNHCCTKSMSFGQHQLRKISIKSITQTWLRLTPVNACHKGFHTLPIAKILAQYQFSYLILIGNCYWYLSILAWYLVLWNRPCFK